jgi:hypothetical protein
MKLLEQKELHVALKAITKSVTVTRQRVQEIAQQACAYSIIHGDTSIGKMLLEAIAVNKALRKDSLIAYLEKFGNFAWVKAEKTLKFRATFPAGAIASDHEALIVGTKWDEAKRETEATSKWDMEALVRAFITKMNKLASDAANTIENKEALALVEQTFVKWSAEKTLKSMVVDNAVVEAGEASEAIVAAREAAASTPPVEVPAAVQLAA